MASLFGSCYRVHDRKFTGKHESILPLLVKLERLCWNTDACCQPPEEANGRTERPRPGRHPPGHPSAVATLGRLIARPSKARIPELSCLRLQAGQSWAV